jgi:hypothetical protein
MTPWVTQLPWAIRTDTVTARAPCATADKLGLKAQIFEVSEVVRFEGAFGRTRDDRAKVGRSADRRAH